MKERKKLGSEMNETVNERKWKNKEKEMREKGY